MILSSSSAFAPNADPIGDALAAAGIPVQPIPYDDNLARPPAQPDPPLPRPPDRILAGLSPG